MLGTELHLDCNIKEEHRYNNKGNTHTQIKTSVPW